MFEFKTLDELSSGDSETTLLWGAAGSGKTFFCGTSGERTLFINIGLGATTLKSPLFRSKFPNAGKMLTITIETVVNAYGMPKDWKYFDMVCDIIDDAIAKHGDRFDTIVIDDGSTLHKYAIMKAIERNGDLGLSQSKVTSAKHNLLAPAIQDYQAEMSIVDQFLAGTTMLAKRKSKHLILTAHERYSYKKGKKVSEEKELIKVTPAFTGVDNNPDLIVQYFDNVWHTEVVGGGSDRVYRITTQGHEKLAAKTRFAGVFNTVEKDLTWPKALERIQAADPSKKLVGVRT